MTREELKTNFLVRLLNEMNPGSPCEESPRSPQVFGEWIVRVNCKKHRSGDKIIVRVGRGTSAKKAEWWWTLTWLIDAFDPISEAKDVAHYLRLKMGKTGAN